MQSSPTFSASDSRMLSEVLRPRTIGDILDATIRLYRRHFLLYFSIALSVQVVMFVASMAFVVPYTILQQQFMPNSANPTPPDPQALFQDPTLIIATVLGGIFAFSVFMVGTQLQQGALIVGVSNTFLGQQVSVGDAFAAVLKRFWTIVGYGILTTLLVFGVLVAGLAIGAIPIALAANAESAGAIGLGILFAVGVFLALLLVVFYLLLALVLGPQAIMLEGAGVGDALSRSWYLMRHLREPGIFNSNIFRAGILVTIIGILQAMVIGAVSMIAMVGVIVVALFVGDMNVEAMAAMPLYIQIPMNLVQSVLNAAVIPLGLIALILFYYDVRIRFEGFDLQVLSGALDSR